MTFVIKDGKGGVIVNNPDGTIRVYLPSLESSRLVHEKLQKTDDSQDPFQSSLKS